MSNGSRTHSGVCHSDLSVMKNGWQMPFPVPDSMHPQSRSHLLKIVEYPQVLANPDAPVQRKSVVMKVLGPSLTLDQEQTRMASKSVIQLA